MSLTFTDDGSGFSSSTTSNFSFTPYKATGDLYMVQIVLGDSGRTITAPSGWTAGINDGGPESGQQGAVFYKVMDGSEASTFTFSWTGGASTHARTSMRVRSTLGAVGINQFGASQTTVDGASPYSTQTITAADNYVIYGAGGEGTAATSTWTGNAGDTQIAQVSSGIGTGESATVFRSSGTHNGVVNKTITCTVDDRFAAIWWIANVTESAGGSDISSSDTGSGADTGTLSTSQTKTETASATETSTTAVTLSSTDVVSATETQSTTFGGATDTGSGTETQSIAVSFTKTDTGSGTETNTLNASQTRTDTATGTESQSFFVVGAPVSSDTVFATETNSISATFTRTDTASLLESQSRNSDYSDWSEYVSAMTLGGTVFDGDFSLVLGPATIYVADFGTLEPSGLADLDGSWLDLGATLDGVNVTFNNEYEESQRLVQIPNKANARLKKRRIHVDTNLAQPSLTSLLYAMNDGALNSGSGYTSYSPPMIDRATPLTYRTMVIDGWAPGFNSNNRHKKRRIIMRKCLSIEGTDMTYAKDKQTAMSVTWELYRIDDSTAPFKVIDEL